MSGAGVAVAGLIKLASSTAETTDNIDKMSQKLGMSRQAYQEWDFILSQSGASIDSMKGGIKTLTNMYDDLGKGTATATEAFGRLGLSYESMAGMSQEEIFETTVTALQGVTNETERAALANDLLGKSGSELAPLLASGSGSIEEMKKKAEELGLVLSDDTIDAGVTFTDTMDQAKRSMSTMVTSIGAAVMPQIQKLLDWFLAHMPEIKEVATKVFDKISSAIEFIGKHIKVILPILGVFLATMLALKVIGIVTSLISAWSTVTKIASGIQAAFNAIMAANPIFLIVMAIAALIAIIVILVKHWDDVKAAAEKAWNWIKGIWEGVATWFKENIIDPIVNFFTGLWDGIKSIFSAVVDFLYRYIYRSLGRN